MINIILNIHLYNCYIKTVQTWTLNTSEVKVFARFNVLYYIFRKCLILLRSLSISNQYQPVLQRLTIYLFITGMFWDPQRMRLQQQQ